VLGKDGEPVWRASYLGLHARRDFFASWCIDRRADGGLALPLKVVQERLGHSSVTMTADRYGHVFPRGDESRELAVAEAELLGCFPARVGRSSGPIIRRFGMADAG
jgi:integrase